MTLTLDRVNCYYGGSHVLRGGSLRVEAGGGRGRRGRNGAGKTTTLRAIMGLLRPRSGRIALDGTDLGPLPAHEIPRHGIAYVPQGRRLFPSLTAGEKRSKGE